MKFIDNYLGHFHLRNIVYYKQIYFLAIYDICNVVSLTASRLCLP
jgi:hypothetical protein